MASEYVEQRNSGYLGHQEEVEANIQEGEAELERLVPPLSQSRPDVHARLQRAREELGKRP